ncbi:HNH endonuclease [Streptomyces cacaoi]|uniref:HNH endonuclease n=1 Tax=Streptomyces cacaoi TaxID=1898 RepID=UPI00260559B4|nr:HNH endonuclease signature motif containing protein [Streptomyces cacaoi]
MKRLTDTLRTVLRALLRPFKAPAGPVPYPAVPLPAQRSSHGRKRSGSSKARRKRKAGLARRDGLVCRYCRKPFAASTDATLDHVVPYRYLRTYAQAHLVLACLPCNRAKGDYFPRLIALGVLRATDAMSAEELVRLLPLLAACCARQQKASTRRAWEVAA